MRTTGSASSDRAETGQRRSAATLGGRDARHDRKMNCIVQRAVRKTIVPALLLSLTAANPAASQSTTPESTRPPACAAAEHRQFDFWVGEWEVRDPHGKVVGHNRIEKAHGGCVLIEQWTSVARVTGTSVNVYDRDHGKWHQTWVDSGGGLLQLDGALVGNAMVLTGEVVDVDAPSKRALQ